MLNIIQVLAIMGSDATVQSNDAIASLLIESKLDSTIVEAVINKDIISLERQLDICPDVVCIISPAEDDDKEKDDDEEKDKNTSEQNNTAIGF